MAGTRIARSTSRAVCDRLYVSKRYKELVVAAKKGAARENAETMKEVDADERVLNKKTEKDEAQHTLDGLFDASKENQNEIEVLEREEQILLEKQRMQERKEEEERKKPIGSRAATAKN